ncbi:MAG: hypothetical protein U0L05_00680 [Schaedlerella sp.]|nr:hypothetical protein [Schaedlerella sp.]
MRERIRRFMQGRYGVDQFSQFLMGLGLVLVLVSSFIPVNFLASACYIIGWGNVIYAYVRLLSRNISKRYSENQLFLTKTQKFRRWFTSQKNLMQQKKMYRIYTCPGCKQKIRIPKGKGKIEVRCPKCGTTFIKKS